MLTRVELTMDCAHPALLPSSGRSRPNRLHLDLLVSGHGTPEQKWSRVIDEAARLSAAGGVVVQEFAGHHVVMTDSEGNEFCVA